MRAIKAALKELAPKRVRLDSVLSAATSALGGSSPSPAPLTKKRGWVTAASALGTPAQPIARSSNLRVKKQFSDYDLDLFRQEGFDFIAKYFQNSLEELAARNPALNQVFRRIDADHFSAAVYRNGEKVCMGSASLSGGMMGSGAIEYAMTDDPRFAGMNEAVHVKADDQTMYFEPLGMQTYGRDKEKLTQEGAAEMFWELFIRPLQ